MLSFGYILLFGAVRLRVESKCDYTLAVQSRAVELYVRTADMRQGCNNFVGPVMDGRCDWPCVELRALMAESFKFDSDKRRRVCFLRLTILVSLFDLKVESHQ